MTTHSPYDPRHNDALKQWLDSFPRPSRLRLKSPQLKTEDPKDAETFKSVYPWLVKMQIISAVHDDEFESTHDLLIYLNDALPETITKAPDFESHIMCAINNQKLGMTCARHTAFWVRTFYENTSSAWIEQFLTQHNQTILDQIIPHGHVHTQFDIEGSLSDQCGGPRIDLLIDGTFYKLLFQKEKALMTHFRKALIHYFLLMDQTLYEDIHTFAIHHGLYMQTVTVDLETYFSQFETSLDTMKKTFDQLTNKKGAL